MVGLLILKQLENLSDERIVLQFKRNPYYQYFCGHSNYIPDVARFLTWRKWRILRRQFFNLFNISSTLGNIVVFCQFVKPIDNLDGLTADPQNRSG
jgi:hypothetical protein